MPGRGDRAAARLASIPRSGNGYPRSYVDLGAPLTRFAALNRKKLRGLRAIRDVCLVVAAFALLASQALSTLHFVLVPHHLCALHGVLEDGTHGPSVADQAPSDERSRDTVTTSDAGSQDAHEACNVATRPVHTTLPARPALERSHIGGAFVAVAALGVEVTPDRAALLSSAPKTSPPARS